MVIYQIVFQQMSRKKVYVERVDVVVLVISKVRNSQAITPVLVVHTRYIISIAQPHPLLTDSQITH